MSLRDALSLTAYRELRPQFEESDLLPYLREDPALIEEWLLYSDDKRTSGGWYLSEDAPSAGLLRKKEFDSDRWSKPLLLMSCASSTCGRTSRPVK